MKQKQTHREKSLGTISPVDVPLEAIPIVELNANQVRRSAELAEDRQDSYESFEGSTVFGSLDSLSSHQIGILGEMAVAELFTRGIDQEVYKFGDGGIDLTLWEKTADVKATKTEKMQLPQLLVCEDNDFTADLFFLAHIIEWDSHGARVRVIGYATQEQVSDREPYRHPGRTKNYVLDPNELTLSPFLQVDG